MSRSNVLTLRRAWSTLAAPTLDDVAGTLRAEFVTPLRGVAPAGLGLVGLPNWFGKRFVRDGPGRLSGVNLIRPRGGSSLVESLPMTAVLGPSLADGGPALVISYAPDAPRPWRWVRDELRVREDGVLVGMTYADRLLLRQVGGTPFLLHRGDRLPAGPGG